MLTALIIDPSIWPGTSVDVVAVGIEQIIRSSAWVGPVLVPTIEAPAIGISELVSARGLPARIAVLPLESEARVAALRRAFIAARGDLLRNGTSPIPNAERLPILTGVTIEKK